MSYLLPKSLGYQTDFAVRATEGSEISRKEGYWRIETPSSPTFYWGNFLLLDESLHSNGWRFATELFTDEFPNSGHIAIGYDTTSAPETSFRDFINNGIDLEETTILLAKPESIISVRTTEAIIRPLVSENDWSQYVELGTSTRGEGFSESGYRDYLNSRVPEKRKASANGKAMWFGAFAEGQLASHLGIYDAGEGVSRYQQIATLPTFQRNGFASDLIRVASDYAASVFAARRLVIAADPTYHAINLYKNLGFEIFESQVQLQRKSEQ